VAPSLAKWKVVRSVARRISSRRLVSAPRSESHAVVEGTGFELQFAVRRLGLFQLERQAAVDAVNRGRLAVEERVGFVSRARRRMYDADVRAQHRLAGQFQAEVDFNTTGLPRKFTV